MDAKAGTVNSLALFGAAPAFRDALHVGRPNLGDRARLLARIGDILDRRWLTNRGPYVQEFEQSVAALTGTEHCVAVGNGTAALDLTARALGLRGEVIVPSLTFVATAHALQWQGLRPVFCDVDPVTLTLDPARVEALIGPHTTGILPVHLFGQPCDTEALADIARRHHLQLFYDASHAFGCTRGGQPVGGFGAAEVFSFHATKFVHTLEGGAVTTNDGDLAMRLRRMQNFGFAGYDDVRMLGTNAKMNEFSAAMGVTLLESIDEIAATNRRHHESYRAELAAVPGLYLREPVAAERHNWQYVIVEVDAAEAGLDRDTLVELLHAENVIARRYFHPGCHRMEPYRTQDPAAGLVLPVTERMTARLLCLPTGTAVTAEDIAKIAALLRFAVDNAAEIRRRRVAHAAALPVAATPASPPLVSILIPAYSPTYFPACLQSALAQTYPNLEIVVVDDCPTEGIAQILAGPLAKDPRIRALRNTSPVGARDNYRRCFEAARGTYIKFLNDDDVLHPTCVERLVQAYEANPGVTLVTSHRRRIDARGHALPDDGATAPPVQADSRIAGASLIQALLESQRNFVGEPTTALFRKRDLEDARPDILSFGGEPVTWNVDVAMWLHLLTRGDAVYLTDSLSQFRQHGAQQQSSTDARARGEAGWEQMRQAAARLGLWSANGGGALEVQPLPERKAWPAAVLACVTQAGNALAADDLEAAHAALVAAVELAPEHGGLHHMLGNVALQRGDVSAARAAFQATLRLAPHAAAVHADLAAVHAHDGRLADAVAAAHHALVLDPATASAEKLLAALERGEGRHDEALARYARVLGLDPSDLDALVDTGACCVEMGRTEDARAFFAGVLAMDAAHTGARAALAEVDPVATVAAEVPDAGDLDVSILIPVFNRLDLTRDCIDSIHAHSPRGRFEIVVVDNGSTDGVSEYLREQHQSGRLHAILNPKNLGFAPACNQAAAAARGRHLLFLNNDTEVQPGWLEPLVRVLDTDPVAAAVGSKLLFPDGSLQHVGVVLVEDQVSGHGLSPYHLYYREPADLPAANQPRTYRVLTAACVLMRRSAFVQAGGFDERYWNGYEDVDLCLKLHVRGWRLVYEPQSLVIHKESQSGPERFRRESDNLSRLREIWGQSISVDVEMRADGTCAQTDSRFIRDYERREPAVMPAPPAADATPLVSVVVVTYNSAHTIRDCLESVLQHATVPLEIVVVDNASPDATREALAHYRGRIHTVLSRVNCGFSRGTNLGIHAARGQYIVLLNPDTAVTAGWLERLIAHVQPGVGAVGPVSDYVAGLQKFEHYLPARRPGVLSMDGVAALLAQHNAGRSVDTKLLIGFCMLVPRSVFEQVGELDDELFLGNDDLDLSWRLRQRGYRLAVATDVFVHHEGQVSFKSEPHSKTARLVQESTDHLYSKLVAYYGVGQVPPPTELWDIDWFRPNGAVFRPRGRKMQPGLTSIIVLAWNGWEHTQKCLASVFAHTKQPYEVIVVDNGSTDGTVDELRRLAAQKPQMRVIANRHNRGFAAGNNQGLAIARGEFVLFLNNDTIVTAGWLKRMRSVLEREPNVGIVGPVSNSVSGPQLVPDAVYDLPAGLQAYATRWAGEHDGDTVAANRVVGFCLLARTELVDRIGGLDEQFGSGNFEDDDFCVRAAHAGYQARIARDVFIHHTGSQTFKAAKIDYRQSLERNWGLFKSKWNLPAARALEAGYRFPPQPGPDTRLYTPLPDVRAGHRAEMDARWWQEPGVDGATTAALAGGAPAGAMPASAARFDAPRVEIVVAGSLRDAAALWQSLVQHTSVPCSITLAMPSQAAGAAVRPQSLPAEWTFAAVQAPAVSVLNEKLRTSAQPVVLLSPDAVLTPGWAKRLLAALARDPRIAAAGPTTNEAASPQGVKCDYNGAGKSLRQFAVRRAHRHAKQWVEANTLESLCIALRPAAFAGTPLDETLGLDAALAAAFPALRSRDWQTGVALDAHVHRECIAIQPPQHSDAADIVDALR